MPRTKKHIFIETILIFAFTMGLFFWLSTILSEANSDAAFVVLVAVPFVLSFFTKDPLRYFDISVPQIKQSLKWFLIWTVIIYALAIPVNHFYQKLFLGVGYHTPQANLGIWLTIMARQIFVIGLCEEFFFRGYLQENISRIFPSQTKLFGAKFGFATLLTCVIFTISHSLILGFVAWHLLIFFPALVFAWLKEKTGTIWASVLFHAISNVFSFWVFQSYQ